MKSIWSLWTKPFEVMRGSVWPSEKHYLLSWVLSLETARKHYPKTNLYTDDEGARILIDGIGLEFESVSTGLNLLHNYDPGWWAIGKIYTYRSQTETFIHIDNDVFLWHPLPARMEIAPVFAQNPEHIDIGTSWYRPEIFDSLMKVNGWIPKEVEWYRSFSPVQKGVCCGIVGGNRIDFINHYAKQAINLLTHSRNRSLTSLLGEDNILIEQYLLSACIEYHRNKESSRYHEIHIEYLFDSSVDAFNPENSTKAGYTHLIGGAKRNKDLADRLENRVLKDYPEYYERCIKYLNNKRNRFFQRRQC